jgi:hypothetical protein
MISRLGRSIPLLLVSILVLGLSPLRGQTTPPEPGPDTVAALRKTQLTLSLSRGPHESRFRATVIGKRQDELTILTAAHCVGSDHVGATIRIRLGDEPLTGRVQTVAHNPFYRPLPSADIPGADNAVAILRVDLDDEHQAEVFRGIAVAEVTARLVPDPNGQTLRVRMTDQFEKDHDIRAGNYTSPRWLEWGPAFYPVPGDSGSGVFLVRKGADGSPKPVLIGVVVDRSSRGGGASLVSRSFRWLDEAIISAARKVADGGAGGESRGKAADPG